MRVSTSQIYSLATLGMTNAQAAVVKTQEQMATGKRVLSPADDPVAATTILQLNQELARTEQYAKNINLADNSLNLEETNLQSIVGLVQRMREIAVSAGNTAVMTSENYKSLAAEVDTRIAELVNLQNTRNASGQYIFAGYQSGTQPFVGDGGGNFSYHGDDGQLRLQASASVSVAVSDSGKKIFVDIPSGHNTFITSASASNKSVPPAVISVGQVFDQEEFDKLYPHDLVVSFTKSGTGINFNVSERASGKQLLVNQPYIAGEDIEVAGARFKVLGNPHPGEAAIAASLPFSAAPPIPVAAINPGDTLRITVGGKTEEFTFPAGVVAGDTVGFVAALNTGSAVPPALPTGNAAKLANLGIVANATELVSATGLNITVSDGAGTSASAIMGSASGTRSVNLPFSIPIVPHNFSATPTTFQLEVNGKTESITFNQNITNATDLAAAFNSPANAAQLARLGLSVTEQGIISNNNAVVTIKGGNLFLDGVVGLNTQGAGESSSRGVVVQPGDSFFVDSTDKQALLTTLSRFSDAMKSVSNTPESKAELAKMVAKTLTNLTNVETNLGAVLGEVGSRLNTLESSTELNLDVTLFTKTTLSSLQDLDYADASIKLSMQSFVLTAAQQSFSKVSQLTLFNYL